MAEKDTKPTVWLSPLVKDPDFNVSFRDDHVHVVMGPEFKVEPGQQNVFWSRLRSICEQHGSKRVLVEGFIPRGERRPAEVVEAGMRTATVPDLWLAFSLTAFEPTEQSELYIAIAASQGVRVKFFSDSELALKWLRNNAPA
jgi:hypothetical protein